MALAASVDTLIHNEALTDYALPYRKLFRPNVLGTVNVIRLALTLRAKAVAFISRCSSSAKLWWFWRAAPSDVAHAHALPYSVRPASALASRALCVFNAQHCFLQAFTDISLMT